MLSASISSLAICPPISSLLQSLLNAGSSIQSQTLRDYHFSELYFEVTPPANEIQVPEGITLNSSGVYTCACHWSTVKIIGG